MRPLSLDAVRAYVNDNIGAFHAGRVQKLEGLKLNELLKRKNPYLFRARNIGSSQELVESFLDASLSSSEEERFGEFLEGLAIFVSGQTSDGRKSAVPGVDLEFTEGGTHYLVSIKSGPNWGNNSQHERLAQNLNSAVTRIRQNDRNASVRTVLGCCYGRSRTVEQTNHGWKKVVGQSFWHFISDDVNLYKDIVEPIGHRAKERNDEFRELRKGLVNKLAAELTDRFCNDRGLIDWPKLVEFNSGNMNG